MMDAGARLDGIVSRETKARLEILAAQLRKWTPAINLISKGSVAQLEIRHILDSAQLFRFAPPGKGHWADLGSGGGFPGLVIAAVAHDENPAMHVTLVESDLRKAAFLEQTARAMGVTVQVIAQRIESLDPLDCTILSARALASLNGLCGHASIHLRRDGVALFPKGRSYRDEIAEAKQNWTFHHEVHPSMTDPEAVILALREVSHV